MPAEEKQRNSKKGEQATADGATLPGRAIDGKASGERARDSPRVAVSEHPRASRFVRQAREVGALGGFLVGTWMSLATHGLTEALLRGIVAGVVCQLVVWAIAVLLCRHLIIAEIESREQALMQAAAARLQAGRRGVDGHVRTPIQGRAKP
jgi:hypothetical protein